MGEEWIDLPTLPDVARAQADGWEIERFIPRGYGWNRWDGLGWSAEWLFHGRPRRPKMEKVKSECWRNVDGFLTWRSDHNPVNVEGWTRLQAGDIEGEVPA